MTPTTDHPRPNSEHRQEITCERLSRSFSMDRFQNTRQPDWEWWSELWPEPKQILDKLGVSANQSVADVGSGNGYFTVPVAELVDPATVYAIDVDANLLEELSEEAAERGLSNINCIEGDARKLSSILPQRVDTVLIANTFHGIEQPTLFAEQVYQSLTPGGRLVIINWHDRSKEQTSIAGKPRGPPTNLRLTPAETREAIALVPFADLETVELPPHHYALIYKQ